MGNLNRSVEVSGDFSNVALRLLFCLSPPSSTAWVSTNFAYASLFTILPVLKHRCVAVMVQKRSVKAPGGAEVRRSTDRWTCEVADQGQKHPISSAMGETEPKRARAKESSADRTRVLKEGPQRIG